MPVTGALICLVGIVNHVTHVEWRWIDRGMLGQETNRSDAAGTITRVLHLGPVFEVGTKASSAPLADR